MVLIWFAWLGFVWAKTLAVLDFESKRDDDFAEILSDQARAGALEVLDPLTWSIITRENMVQVLRDMGKDLDCIEGSCEVDIARNIGADVVISGGLSQVDSLYLITLKLYDAGSGQLLAMETVSAEEKVPLVEKSFQASRALLVKGLRLTEDPVLVWLTVNTKPSAQLFIDGELLCQKTPCRRQVSQGSHEIRLEASEFMPITENIILREDTEIQRELSLSDAQLQIEGLEKGIGLFLDGRPLGTTPLWKRIEAGSHEVSIADPCWEGAAVHFTAQEGEKHTVRLQASPITTRLQLEAIDVDGNPQEAQVYLGESLIGTTADVLRVPLCNEEAVFHVERRGQVWSGQITLEGDSLNRRLIQLETAQTKKSTNASLYPLVEVQGGRFWMGSAQHERGRNRDEEQHQVHLSSGFLIGEREVSQNLWQSIMKGNPSSNLGCGGNCPVDSVSWCDAVLFANRLSKKEGLKPAYRLPYNFRVGMDTRTCNSLAVSIFADPTANGYRLPTEAEWEFVARDISYHQRDQDGIIDATTVYSGGNLLDEVAWYNQNASNRSHTSCEKARNEMGVCDMTGNVFEWVGDWYGADTSMFPNINPIGPLSGQTKVLRGGSYQSNANVLRNAFRHSNEPGYRSEQIGFRLVRNL